MLARIETNEKTLSNLINECQCIQRMMSMYSKRVVNVSTSDVNLSLIYPYLKSYFIEYLMNAQDFIFSLFLNAVVFLTKTSSLTTNRISRNTSIIYLSTVKVRDEYESCRRRLSVETTFRDRSSLHHESIYKIASNKCRKI